MIRWRTLWADWIRALGLGPRRPAVVWSRPASAPRPGRIAGRLDARGLQRMLNDAYAPPAAAPAPIEEPPRKAVGS